jgi:hypothetical protein
MVTVTLKLNRDPLKKIGGGAAEAPIGNVTEMITLEIPTEDAVRHGLIEEESREDLYARLFGSEEVTR